MAPFWHVAMYIGEYNLHVTCECFQRLVSNPAYRLNDHLLVHINFLVLNINSRH